MQGMDADEYIVILINQFDGLLHLTVHLGAYQSSELSYAMIDMYDIIPCENWFSSLSERVIFPLRALSLFRLNFVEAVEQLMVR